MYSAISKFALKIHPAYTQFKCNLRVAKSKEDQWESIQQVNQEMESCTIAGRSSTTSPFIHIVLVPQHVDKVAKECQTKSQAAKTGELHKEDL